MLTMLEVFGPLVVIGLISLPIIPIMSGKVTAKNAKYRVLTQVSLFAATFILVLVFQIKSELYKIIQDESVAIILITTLCIQTCPEVIADMKLKLRRPLIVEIPDRHGSAKIGETIDAYISEAIGIKL